MGNIGSEIGEATPYGAVSSAVSSSVHDITQPGFVQPVATTFQYFWVVSAVVVILVLVVLYFMSTNSADTITSSSGTTQT